MDDMECQGLWWLPEAPAEKVAGTLRFSNQEGATLALFGVLGEASSRVAEKAIPAVCGHVHGCELGDEVTLKDCTVSARHLSPAGTREDVRAAYAFIGAHLNGEQDFSFRSARLWFSGLASWADSLTGLSERLMPGAGGGRPGFEIKWAPPPPVQGRAGGAKMALGVTARLEMPRREWAIREQVEFSIQADAPLSHTEWYQRFAYPLQNLLSFATDRPNSLEGFVLARPEGDEGIHVFLSRTFADREAATDLLPHDMLFTLSDAAGKAAELISRWLDTYQAFRVALGPYFAEAYNSHTYVDNQFLSVYQSLEVLARLAADHQPASSFAQPGWLDRMIGGAAPVLDEALGAPPEAVAREAGVVRNYVVHRDSDLGDRPDYGRRLYWLTQRLRFVLKVMLLRELGFPAEQQRQLLRRNRLFVHLLSLAAGV